MQKCLRTCNKSAAQQTFGAAGSLAMSGFLGAAKLEKKPTFEDKLKPSANFPMVQPFRAEINETFRPAAWVESSWTL